MSFKDVVDFHEKFGVPVADKPQFLNKEALDFRVGFLQEELNEYIESVEAGDLATAYDSLLDLVYVAYGTAHMMGVNAEMWEEMWQEIQRANMTKVRAANAGESKRGTSLDVVKPLGWTSPQHEPIIEKYSK